MFLFFLGGGEEGLQVFGNICHLSLHGRRIMKLTETVGVQIAVVLVKLIRSG